MQITIRLGFGLTESKQDPAEKKSDYHDRLPRMQQLPLLRQMRRVAESASAPISASEAA